jgi:cholesterol oxidase
MWDYVVIGSGFGGSVAALRLAEKGYSVLVLEQGRRWRDQDLPKTNWNLRRFLWAPWLRFLDHLNSRFFVTFGWFTVWVLVVAVLFMPILI